MAEWPLRQVIFNTRKRMEDKMKWINQKGFITYISKQTILKNAHMIDNILYKEPALKNPSYNFRQVEKTKWVGKTGFYA